MKYYKVFIGSEEVDMKYKNLYYSRLVVYSNFVHSTDNADANLIWLPMFADLTVISYKSVFFLLEVWFFCILNH